MSSNIIAPRNSTDVEIVRLKIAAGDEVPNNPWHPAVIARDALGGAHDDRAVRSLMERNGWGGTWTSIVFDYHHFHPDAFEALAVAAGSATLMLGGPQGETVDVRAGDVMILPPGFGHRRLALRDNFQICGAYPPGQEHYTVVRGSSGYDDAMLRQIADVAKPGTDPVWNAGGALLKALLGSG
jgi:uncharacterized protein YjlB